MEKYRKMKKLYSELKNMYLKSEDSKSLTEYKTPQNIQPAL